jgi:hypothetical protein
MGSLDPALLRTVEALLAEVKLLRTDVHDGFDMLAAMLATQYAADNDDAETAQTGLALMEQIAARPRD